MGRHLRRRFSLQPSFMKDDNDNDKPRRDKWVIIIICYWCGVSAYVCVYAICKYIYFFALWLLPIYLLSIGGGLARAIGRSTSLGILATTSTKAVTTIIIVAMGKKSVSCVLNKIPANLMEILQIIYSAVHSLLPFSIVCSVVRLFIVDWTIWAFESLRW